MLFRSAGRVRLIQAAKGRDVQAMEGDAAIKRVHHGRVVVTIVRHRQINDDSGEVDRVDAAFVIEDQPGAVVQPIVCWPGF